jgi:hypothetical protein
VVADERHHATARTFGFTLELAEQIQRASSLRPAIDEIAGLDQDGAAADPPLPVVDELRGLQNLDEPLVRAVNVSDCDYAVRRREITR